ncbi:phthiocerol/phthiodiolone dimycocerosyl transferase family protein [Actinomadura oligospora]|uniref:phthiocerol/phthiodiolone dimycocerosyl transferase family protein n=1 Tax=Actinomadura oligospora TaxID=111804 RepID=UPI00047B1756|nr:hypothetical protein [Actinomadura oligospora]
MDDTRALSPSERWYWIADQLAPLTVCARVRLEGDPSSETLTRALGALQARHPLLRVAVRTNPAGGDPHFVPTGRAIPLREVVLYRADEERWAREADEQELPTPIDWRRGPLSRAVVIRQPDGVNDLIFAIPHYIADATTAVVLLREWVRLAADRPERSASAPHGDRGSVTPPVEAAFPARFRRLPGTLPNKAAAEETSGPAGAEMGRLEAERFVPFDRRRTRLLHRSIPGDALEGLALACKRNGVSMHGLLAAALVSAVARDAAGSPATHFAVGSPISIRDELDPPVPEDEVGAYASALPSAVRYRPDDPWTMARDIARDLAERRDLGEHFAAAGILEELGPATVAESEPFVRYMEEHGPFNFYFSNLGRFDFPAEIGGWRLSGATFCGGISVVGYFASVAISCHDQMSWNFTYVEGAISRDRAERLAGNTIDIALAAAETVE